MCHFRMASQSQTSEVPRLDVVDDVQLVAEPVDVLWLEAGRGLGQQGWFSLVKLREVSWVRKEYPR